MNEIVASFIAIAFAALIISYKGPECIASFKLKQEYTERVIRRREATRSAKESNPETRSGRSNSVGSVLVIHYLSIGWFASLLSGCYHIYLVVSHKRKDIMMLSMRLIIGWTWEIVFKEIFLLIGTAEEDNQQLNTGLQCILALCIVGLALAIHLNISEWNRPADPSEREEEEQAGDNTATAVDASYAPPVSQVITDSETRSPLN